MLPALLDKRLAGVIIGAGRGLICSVARADLATHTATVTDKGDRRARGIVAAEVDNTQIWSFHDTTDDPAGDPLAPGGGR